MNQEPAYVVPSRTCVELANDSPTVFLKAAMNIASMDFFSVLNRFDTVALNKRLKQKPELFFQLINSYANLTKASLEQQKFALRQKQAQAGERQRAQNIRAHKPVLINTETVAAIRSTIAQGPLSHVQKSPPPPAPAQPNPDTRDADAELARIVEAELRANDLCVSWHERPTGELLAGCPS